MYKRCLAAVICLLQVSACTPQIQTDAGARQTPELMQDEIIMADGYRLPLVRWTPDTDAPCRVVLAIHGFNDFHMAFESLTGTLTENCTAVYAYDQRGFGATEQRGIWPGEERLVKDAVTVTSLLRRRYPDTPLYLLGESMGAAVVMLALAGETPPSVEGAVLLAPAVWARTVQPWYTRTALWLGVRILPGLKLSSEILGIEVSDVPEVQEYWREHPMVIQHSRVDALHGVTDLMDSALAAAGSLQGPALILYGGNDEIIPPEAVCALLDKLPDPTESSWRFVFYPEGYHSLTRDSRADETIDDIAVWLESRQAPLPSGLELDRTQAKERLCEQKQAR